MVALDLIEQGDAARLHTEDADAIGDFGPFSVEIGLDEVLAEGSDMCWA